MMRPSEKPLAAKVVKIEMALLRSGPSSKLVVISENAAGAVNAAATPLTNRLAIRRPASIESPPARDATVKTLSATRSTVRRPSRSARRPPSSRRLP